jgi:hypothetical protein
MTIWSRALFPKLLCEQVKDKQSCIMQLGFGSIYYSSEPILIGLAQEGQERYT